MACRLLPPAGDTRDRAGPVFGRGPRPGAKGRVLVSAGVVLGFAADPSRRLPETFATMAVVAGLAIVLDVVWERMRGPAAGLTATAALAAQE